MRYLNNSYAAKTFYGIVVKPGEVAEFKDYVNDPYMVRVDERETLSVGRASGNKPGKGSKPIKPSQPSVSEVRLEQGGKSDGADRDK